MESHCSEHLMAVYIVGYIKEVIKMPFCPAVVQYRVTFSDGTVNYPKLPDSVDVYRIAEQYARETLSEPGNPVTVMSVETIR